MREAKLSVQVENRSEKTLKKARKRKVNCVNEQKFPTDPEQPNGGDTSASEEAFERLLESVRSHDQFFKTVMQDVDRARRFLQWALPEKMLSAIDLSKLERQNESFLDDSLKNSYADLLFKAPAKVELKNGVKAEIPVYVFFLLEHKSYNDFKTTFQILRYIVRIWEQAEKEASEKKKGKRLLPFVLPIIFHHGVTPFTAPVNLRDLICPVTGLEEFLPNWQCKLVDVETVTEDELPEDWELHVILSVFKSIFHKGITEKTTDYFERARPFLKDKAAKELFKTLLLYIVTNAKFVDQKKFEEMVKKMSEIYETAPPKSWFLRECEKYEARGKAEGKAEIAASLLKEGLSVEFIVKTTGLSEQEVKRLATDR